jgi:hypothetical protein
VHFRAGGTFPPPKGDPAMPKMEPARVSIRVASFPHGPAAAGWTPRRLIAAVLVSWMTVAALVAAVVVAIAWDWRP